jgi:hypothetical protein
MLLDVLISLRFRTGERKLLLCIPTRDVRKFKMGMSAKLWIWYCKAEVEK